MIESNAILQDIGLSEINLFSNKLHSDNIEKSKEILRKYLQKEIDKESALNSMKHYIGSTAPIDKIIDISNVSDAPLQNFVDSPIQEGNGKKKIRQWTPDEDLRLLAGIVRFGCENWARIASFVGNCRTRSQCSQRWARTLDPQISKLRWTDDENNKLIQLVQNPVHASWREIARQIGNRSDVQCRYQFIHLMRSYKIDPRYIYQNMMIQRQPVPFIPDKKPQILTKNSQKQQQTSVCSTDIYPTHDTPIQDSSESKKQFSFLADNNLNIEIDNDLVW